MKGELKMKDQKTIQESYREFIRGVHIAMIGRDTLSRGYDWEEFESLCTVAFNRAVSRGKGKKLLDAKNKEIKAIKHYGAKVADTIWKFKLGGDMIFAEMNIETLAEKVGIDSEDYEDSKSRFRTGLGRDKLETEHFAKETESDIRANLRGDATNRARYLFKEIYYKMHSDGKRRGLEYIEILEWMRRQPLVKNNKVNKNLLLLWTLRAALDNVKFIYLANLFAGYLGFPTHKELNAIRKKILIAEWSRLSYEEIAILKEEEIISSYNLKTPKFMVFERGGKTYKFDPKTKKEILIDIDDENFYTMIKVPEQKRVAKTKKKSWDVTASKIAKLIGGDRETVKRIITREKNFQQKMVNENQFYNDLYEGSEDAPTKDRLRDKETGVLFEFEYVKDDPYKAIRKDTGETIILYKEKDHWRNPRYDLEPELIDWDDKKDIKDSINRRKFWHEKGLGYLARQILTVLLFESETHWDKLKLKIIKEVGERIIGGYKTPGQYEQLQDTGIRIAEKGMEDIEARDVEDSLTTCWENTLEQEIHNAQNVALEKGISIEEALKEVGLKIGKTPGTKYPITGKIKRRK